MTVANDGNASGTTTVRADVGNTIETRSVDVAAKSTRIVTVVPPASEKYAVSVATNTVGTLTVTAKATSTQTSPLTATATPTTSETAMVNNGGGAPLATTATTSGSGPMEGLPVVCALLVVVALRRRR